MDRWVTATGRSDVRPNSAAGEAVYVYGGLGVVGDASGMDDTLGGEGCGTVTVRLLSRYFGGSQVVSDLL